MSGDGDGPASDSYATDCVSQPENPDCLDLEYPTTSVATGVPIRPDVDCTESFYVPRIECLEPEASTTTVPESFPPRELPETGVDSLNVALIGASFMVVGFLSLVGAAYSKVTGR